PASSGPREERHVGLKLFALFSGLAIPFVIAIGAWLAVSAHQAATRAEHAAAATHARAAAGPAMPGMSATTTAGGSPASASCAGVTPEDADSVAQEHTPFSAALAPAPAGSVAKVTLAIQHRTIEIAPGIRYHAWTFGPTVPGPTIHVRVGQKVVVHLK